MRAGERFVLTVQAMDDSGQRSQTQLEVSINIIHYYHHLVIIITGQHQSRAKPQTALLQQTALQSPGELLTNEKPPLLILTNHR